MKIVLHLSMPKVMPKVRVKLHPKRNKELEKLMATAENSFITKDEYDKIREGTVPGDPAYVNENEFLRKYPTYQDYFHFAYENALSALSDLITESNGKNKATKIVKNIKELVQQQLENYDIDKCTVAKGLIDFVYLFKNNPIILEILEENGLKTKDWIVNEKNLGLAPENDFDYRVDEAEHSRQKEKAVPTKMIDDIEGDGAEIGDESMPEEERSEDDPDYAPKNKSDKFHLEQMPTERQSEELKLINEIYEANKAGKFGGRKFDNETAYNHSSLDSAKDILDSEYLSKEAKLVIESSTARIAGMMAKMYSKGPGAQIAAVKDLTRNVVRDVIKGCVVGEEKNGDAGKPVLFTGFATKNGSMYNKDKERTVLAALDDERRVRDTRRELLSEDRRARAIRRQTLSEEREEKKRKTNVARLFKQALREAKKKNGKPTRAAIKAKRIVDAFDRGFYNEDSQGDVAD